MDSPERTDNLCVRILKKSLRFLISHVGLTSLIVGYSLLGAIVLSHLENPVEDKARRKISHLRQQHAQNLWLPTEKYNVLSEDAWKEQVRQEFRQFQREIYDAVKHDGWDGQEVGDEPQWSFARSLLFSVSVITTIGYGDIAPKSSWGRVFTMVYALVGIPLLLICLANTGQLMAGCLRFLYGSFLDCRCKCERGCVSGCCKNCRSERMKTRRGVVYQSAIEMQDSGQKLAPTLCEAEVVSQCDVTPEEDIVRDARVPGWISLLIMVFYTSLGATLFSYWENWTYFESCYFCFVTLTTIGFGDFVPGMDVGSWHSQEKRVFCTLYLLFGLTLLVMCFNLLQDNIRQFSRKIGINIHLLSDNK